MVKDDNPTLDLVELAYERDRGSQDWLEEIGTILGRIVPGVVSCYVFEVDRVDDRVVLGARWFEDRAIGEQITRFFSEAPGELLDVFHRSPLVGRTSREVLRDAGLRHEATIVPDMLGAMGIRELFAVPAIGPGGRGSVLGMCLDEREGPPAQQRTMLAQLSAHVAAGARLHARLDGASALEDAAAILEPDGTLADGSAAGIAARDLIGQAVRDIERARRRGTDSQEALDLWQGLVDGRWSLVDHYEGDGRRYYVAVENSTEAARSKALTPREAQVVAYLASGTPSQNAAYALGLKVVTVRGHLKNAMEKLGVRDRAELIGLRASLLGRAAPADDLDEDP